MTKTKTLSVREAAQALNCTIPYIFQLLWVNRLPGAEKHNRKWVIPLAAVEAHKKEQAKREGR